MDDKPHSSIGRREFLQASLYGLTALALEAQDAKKIAIGEDVPVLKKNRIAYDALVAQIRKDEKGDKAGAYEALKVKYLDQILVDEFKLVQDKKRNPDGFVKEWFYWPDPKQQKKAVERMKEEAKKSGQDAQDLDAIVGALPDLMVHPKYTMPMGRKNKDGYVFVDKSIFNLSNEQEVFSTINYIKIIAQGCENGILLNDAELNKKNGTLVFFSETALTLLAKTDQLIQIENGTYKGVTESFKTKVTNAYTTAYSNYENALEQLSKNSTKDGKEAFATMSQHKETIVQQIKRIGYTHKQLPDGKSYELVKVEK